MMNKTKKQPNLKTNMSQISTRQSKLVESDEIQVDQGRKIKTLHLATVRRDRNAILVLKIP